MKEKTKSGKSVAQPRVVLENEEWVRRLARSLVFDANRAEDIVQQTWLELFKRPPERGGNLRGWLTVVVKNVARKMKRSDRNREKREKRTAKEEALEISVAGKQDKDSLQSHILRAVESLDEPYRATVKMRYFEDLAPQEIAARTKTPLDTVYTRLRRGLTQLRAKLDKQYGDRSLWIGIAMRLFPEMGEAGPAAATRPAVSMKSYGSIVAGSAAAILALTAASLLIAVPSAPQDAERTARTQMPVSEQREDSASTRSVIETPAQENGANEDMQDPDARNTMETGLDSASGTTNPTGDVATAEDAKQKRIPQKSKLSNNKPDPAEADPTAQVKTMPKDGVHHSQKKFQINSGKGLSKPGSTKQ